MTMSPNERAADRSMGSMIRDLTQAVSDLIRNEMHLARAELSGKADQMVNALALIIGGFMAALAALIVLLFAVVEALSGVMEAWLAAVIVGIVVALAALAMMYAGQKRLRAGSLVPHRTMESLRADANVARDHTHREHPR